MPDLNPLGSIVGAGLGIIGGIGGLFAAKKSNKQLDQLLKQDPTYKADPIAADRLSLAKNLLNARMPGASQMERNIFVNQANQMGNISQNATDSSQALALGAASQGTTNQALNNLGLEESQDYQRRYGNLVGAQEGQMAENRFAFGDQVRRFEDLAKVRGAQAQNRQQSWNSISQAGFGILNFGAGGGFGKTTPQTTDFNVPNINPYYGVNGTGDTRNPF